MFGLTNPDNSISISHPITFPITSQRFTIGDAISVKVSQSSSPTHNAEILYWNNLVPQFKQSLFSNEDGEIKLNGFYEYSYNFNLLNQNMLYQELGMGDIVHIDPINPTTSSQIKVVNIPDHYEIDKVHLYSLDYRYLGKTYLLDDQSQVTISDLTGSYRIMLQLDENQVFSGVKNFPIQRVLLEFGDSSHIKINSPLFHLDKEDIYVVNFKEVFFNPLNSNTQAQFQFQNFKTNPYSSVELHGLLGSYFGVQWNRFQAPPIYLGESYDFDTHALFNSSNMTSVIIDFDSNDDEDIAISKVQLYLMDGFTKVDCVGPNVESQYACDGDTSTGVIKAIINGQQFISAPKNFIQGINTINIKQSIRVIVDKYTAKNGNISLVNEKLKHLPFIVTSYFDSKKEVQFYTEASELYALRVSYGGNYRYNNITQSGSTIDLTNRPPNYLILEGTEIEESNKQFPHISPMDYSKILSINDKFEDIFSLNLIGELSLHQFCSVSNKNGNDCGSTQKISIKTYSSIQTGNIINNEYYLMAENQGSYDFYRYNAEQRQVTKFVENFLPFNIESAYLFNTNGLIQIKYVDKNDNRTKVLLIEETTFLPIKTELIAYYPIKIFTSFLGGDAFYIDPSSQQLVFAAISAYNRIQVTPLGQQANPLKPIRLAFSANKNYNYFILYSDLDQRDTLSIVEFDSKSESIIHYNNKLSLSPVHDYSLNINDSTIGLAYLDTINTNKVIVNTINMNNIQEVDLFSKKLPSDLKEIRFSGDNRILGLNNKNQLKHTIIHTKQSGVPLISGATLKIPGNTLTVLDDASDHEVTYSDYESNSFTKHYQWERSLDGLHYFDIEDAQKSNYMISFTDSSFKLRCKVILQDQAGLHILYTNHVQVEDPTLSIVTNVNSIQESEAQNLKLTLQLDSSPNIPFYVVIQVQELPLSASHLYLSTNVFEFQVGEFVKEIPLSVR
ncbi:hypothetical protein MJH12_17160, partial [bacterium]|nr:hypothetical protein [bacterium]